MTAEAMCALPEIVELNIGHFIMGEAIYEGLPHVIKRMRAAMTRGRMQVGEDEPPPPRPCRRTRPMAPGIGPDLVDIRRIEQVTARHGDRFINRIFPEVERARAERKANRIDTYAK